MFDTKAEAQAWAVEREAQLRRMTSTGINTDKTLQDAFDRYAKEVSPTKRGGAWEWQRLLYLGQYKLGNRPMGKLRLAEVTTEVIGQWRDARLKEVKASTINRDLALLSHVFTTARKEWKWITVSPISDLRRPEDPPPRDRLISQDEIDKICHSLGHSDKPEGISQRVACAFLLAIETAMRASELCELRWDDVTGSVAHLPQTKNGSKRDVPLSKRAREILATLPRDSTTCLGLTYPQVDANFRKARDRSGIKGLVFHDTRHEAITRLAKKLNVLELARMTGHKDIKQLQVYYNETAAEIAKRLD